MPIVQNIARKQGTITQRPNKPKVTNTIFGPRGQAGANVGDVTNPGNPAYLTLAGVDYNSRLSKSSTSAVNPVGNHSDTATQLYYPPLVPNATTDVVTQDKAKDVQPHEKGSFFSKNPVKRQAQRVSGGVDPNSNTPFHPKTAVITRPVRRPLQPGERKSEPSFLSTQTPLRGVANITLTKQGASIPVNTRMSAGRWTEDHTKISASDHPVATRSTLASPHSGNQVASGTTGNSSTGKGLVNTSVVNNQHSGVSGSTVAWIPQARGVQPNEKGNTNPLPQPCRGLKGCA